MVNRKHPQRNLQPAPQGVPARWHGAEHRHAEYPRLSPANCRAADRDAVFSAPYAAFAPESYTVSVLQPLRFFNRSGGNITSYQWSFGDGTFSNLENPTHTYNQPGSYTVTLTVSGPGGTTAVSSIITAYQVNAPTAAFIADRIVGYAPLTVTFTNQSSPNATSFLWNFGDGTTATTRDAVHAFTSPGNYTVTLTAAGAGGSTIVQRIITVLNVPTPTPTGTPPIQAPIANFRTNQNVGFPPLLVEFTNLSVGTISTINWNFGDGQLSTEANPVHLYTQPGNYTVTLIVTGPGGQSFRQALVIVRELPTNTPTVTPIPPTATPTNTLVPPTNTLTPSPTNTAEIIIVTATFTPTLTAEPAT
ncbi:PKD domain-containing protein, partial [Geitlerinema splendidum]|nr:PKD domain-containing protein [Geitlerinema splendidum]